MYLGQQIKNVFLFDYDRTSFKGCTNSEIIKRKFWHTILHSNVEECAPVIFLIVVKGISGSQDKSRGDNWSKKKLGVCE